MTPAALRVHDQGVRVHERRGARDQRHVVAPELALDHLDLAGDDRVDAGEQLGGRGAVIHAGPRQALGAPGEPREHHGGFAQRLARDSAGIDADPADTPALLDDGGPLAELRGLHGGPLARRTAPDADQVEVIGRAHDYRARPASGPGPGRGDTRAEILKSPRGGGPIYGLHMVNPPRRPPGTYCALGGSGRRSHLACDPRKWTLLQLKYQKE